MSAGGAGGNEALLHIMMDPAIWIVVIVFVVLLVYMYKQYFMVNKNLKQILGFIKAFNPADLTFRFKELDDGMAVNPYISNVWAEFKNTLLFSEDLSMKDQKNDTMFQKVSQSVTHIQTTVDPMYFFNEESLVTSKYDHKFLAQGSTFLTGMGPLFTFLNIGMAFSKLDFSTQATILDSIAGMMTTMQVAATVSVMAVGGALIFIAIEKTSFNSLCRIPLEHITEQFYKLFSNISSEKFLIELLKETKVQNNSVTNLIEVLPEQFKASLDKSMVNTLVPYLENVIYGINTMKEKLDAVGKKGGGGMDDLF